MRGNPGRRPYNLREPKVKPAPSIEAPSWLTGEALVIWNELTPRFLDMGTLADVDTGGLASACFWWGEFRKAADAMKACTSADYKRHFVAAERAHIRFSAGFAEFGMFPGRRSRIIANTPKTTDPLTAHLASRSQAAATA
jgi:phage terminase small subunit